MTDDEAARWGIEPGYHDVFGHWHATAATTRTALVAALRAGRDAPAEPPPPAPAFAFQCGTARLWGLAVQLYSVRSQRNWGHGDFTDLAGLIALAAGAGAAAVGVNPLHALFPERAEDASPYSPNSRLFLNPLYIDLDAVPEFPGLAALGLAQEVAALRSADTVAYARVARAKMQALRACHARFHASGDAARRQDFERFRAAQGFDLKAFAAFEVLRARFGHGRWRDWPPPWRRPEPAQLDALRAEEPAAFEFHEYVQWIAAVQLDACRAAARRHGLPIGLYLDLAVGVDPAGADAWIMQDDMLAGVVIGAPPDQYNPAGQDWGLAAFNPHALAASDGAPLRRTLSAAMRAAGAIRIDHVLGLTRLFLIPDRGGAAQGCVDGAYVRYPVETLLAALAQESVRHRCIVIGEDLGTVPEGLRGLLARYGLWSYRVMLFERESDGAFRAPAYYPENALATFGTHDLPTLQGFLSGHDLAVKRAIGVDPGESDAERDQARAALRHALALHAQGGDDIAAVARYLGESPARLVMVALEDIAGMADQVNVPGTVSRHPNWRRRLPLALEDIAAAEPFRRVAAALAQTGRSCR